MINLQFKIKPIFLAISLISSSFFPAIIFSQNEIVAENIVEVPPTILEMFNDIKKELNITDVGIRQATAADLIINPIFKYIAYATTQNTVVINSDWFLTLDSKMQRIALTQALCNSKAPISSRPVGSTFLIGYSFAYLGVLGVMEYKLFKKLKKQNYGIPARLGLGFLAALGLRLITSPITSKVMKYTQKKDIEQIQLERTNYFLERSGYKPEELLNYYDKLSAEFEKEKDDLIIAQYIQAIDIARQHLKRLIAN